MRIVGSSAGRSSTRHTVGCVGRTEGSTRNGQARDRVFDRPRALILRVRVAQAVDEQVSSRWNCRSVIVGELLREDIRDRAHDVEAVERSLERQVRYTPVEDLEQRLEDVEALAPGERLHSDACQGAMRPAAV